MSTACPKSAHKIATVRKFLSVLILLSMRQLWTQWIITFKNWSSLCQFCSFGFEEIALRVCPGALYRTATV